MGYWLADTPAKELVNLNESMLYNQQEFADSLGMSLSQINSTISSGFWGVNQNITSMGATLSSQMASDSAHLSSTFQAVGASLSENIFQSAAIVSGSTFMGALTTSGLIAKAIKRQTLELKNELLELRTEQMYSRRAITAAQMLTYHELADLRVQTIRNHAETLWALIGQSSILNEIRELLQHPRRTEALELAKTGNFLMERGLFPQAKDSLQEARKIIHDSEPGIAVSLGFAHAHLDEHKATEERLSHAVMLSEDDQFNAWCLGLLSDFYWNKGKKEKSLEFSDKAVSKDPDSIPARINHAALLAETGDKRAAASIIDGLIREDTDSAKPMLDRKSFYRHELIPVIMDLLKTHLHPETETLKEEVTNFKRELHCIQEEGEYRQFKGHKKRFEEALKALRQIENDKSNVSKQDRLRGIRDAQQRLLLIEQDATRAAQANRNFSSLTAARQNVDQFLDAIYYRATVIISDASKHPQLRMEIESIKSSLAGNDNPESLLAACELVLNHGENKTREHEQVWREAAHSKLTGGMKRRKIGEKLFRVIKKLRGQIERLRVEQNSTPFQICAACFARWPRDYKRCGQCGSILVRPLEKA